MELVSVSKPDRLTVATVTLVVALVTLFIKAAVVFAAAALIGRLFGIW